MNVGIIGGGQLAKMLVHDAFQLGLTPFVVAQKKTDCCLQNLNFENVRVGFYKTNFSWLAKHAHVVTFESEFVDLKLLSGISHSKIRPSLKSLQLCQSKLEQKKFLFQNKIPSLPFLPFDSLKQLRGCKVGPCVLKQARLGYDGKGTFIYKNGFSESDIPKLLKTVGDFEGYVEPFVPCRKELSVVVARSIHGKIQTFPVVESVQDEGICLQTLYPSGLPTAVQRIAELIAKKAIAKSKGVGVFGIEMFWLQNGQIVINEMAPRVHNTGHWTMDGCNVSQFEQHWRAILGLPLVAVKALGPTVMLNVLGEEKRDLKTQSAPMQESSMRPEVHFYWYGKRGETLRRKLGHINVCSSSRAGALKQAKLMRKGIKV